MERAPARTIRHEPEHTSWELVLREPDPRLRSFVRVYEGYVESGAPAPVHRQQLPGVQIPLIVNFGSDWQIAASSDPTSRSERHGSFVAGLFESSAFVRAEGAASCVQVDLTPLGAHAFFGVAMHELANRVVDLDDVLPAGSRRLADRLAAAPDWESRFALLDTVLAARLAEARPPSPEVVWAWQALVRSGGRARVGAIAEHLGRSRRHLIGCFREQVGLSPKTVARILRFGRAVETLRRDRTVPLAELAQDCGYYDQAHLTRDCRSFAGLTPAVLARRLGPDGQLLAP
jgi:AraC-like DNA-binding protein